MKAICILALLALTVGLVVYHTQMKLEKVESFKGDWYDLAMSEMEPDFLLEQGSFQFHADDNCAIGSAYKLGLGCDDSRFINVYDLQDQKLEKPVSLVELKTFIVTSASEMNKMVSHKSSLEGGGWGIKVKVGVDTLTKNHDSVNAVSVALTDYRKHKYYNIPASLFKFGEDEYETADIIDWFKDDPTLWYQMHGFYYVTGYTTGSTFSGALNYKSENHAALKDVSVSVGVSFGRGPFSVGGSHDYRNVKDTSDGSTDFSSNINATGCDWDKFDKDDVKGSHDMYQAHIIKEQMMSVTITKYDSNPAIRKAISQITDKSKRDQILAFNRVQSSFLQKISEAYQAYLYLRSQVSQHIMEFGTKTSQENVKRLQEYKRELEDMINFIEELDTIKDLAELRANRDDQRLEYEMKVVEVGRFLKQITGRID